MNDINKIPYINKRDYILYNLGNLGLTNLESLLILLIDFANEKGITVNYDFLKSHLNLNENEIDKLLRSLSAKAYLKLTATEKGIVYDISALFKTEPNNIKINKSIYDLFSEVFARDLTGQEMSKLSELIQKYSSDAVKEALRRADAYRKRDLRYIETILKQNDQH